MSAFSKVFLTFAVLSAVFLSMGDSVNGEKMQSITQKHSRQLSWYSYWYGESGSDSDSDSSGGRRRRRGSSSDSNSNSNSNSNSDDSDDSSGVFDKCQYWWSKYFKSCEEEEVIPPRPRYVQRLNCGVHNDRDGSYRYTDKNGNVWISDNGFSNSNEIENGNNEINIKNTNDDEIYRTGRFISGTNDLVYTFDGINNGIYFIRLRFAEIFFNSPGDRTFDILVNGKVKDSNVDILGEVGKNTAKDFEYSNLEVRYNKLEIRLRKGANDPKCSGIEVYQVDDLH